MPIYMDRHYIEGATRHMIGNAHERDLEVQGKYGVRVLTYWFDEVRCTAFCLADAPSKEALWKTHEEAHGAVPSEIIEVDPLVVQAFLGRVNDRTTMEQDGPERSVLVDPAFRAIMFTDLKDSTAMATELGDTKALHLLHIHNLLTRNALRDYAGQEVKHLGDGIMASFPSVAQAVECGIAIQKAFAAYNAGHTDTALHLRIGLSSGEPVADDHDLFGATVNLAARLCAWAGPDQIFATQDIVDHCTGKESLFSSAGGFNPKGFAGTVPVYEVHWQGM